jgi:bifunctional DNase/RNase
MPRPLTHDLFLSVLSNVGVTLERIEITALKEGTFYAQLVLAGEGKEIVIDSRPSDSLAIAVRHKCKIYIADAVVDEAGVAVSSITEETNLQEVSEDPDPVNQLQADLDKAVAEENYEEAARIRDKMKEMGKEEEE